MQPERVTPEHRCTQSLPPCWHVTARLPGGNVAVFAVRDDASFGAHRTVVFYHPGAEIVSVAAGRTTTGQS